ncbi:MAG TPA: adenylyltransferase/cytidyltransferase family protein, partial [Chlamydiales bacterium]|nr:adenylyltransferase/cytidyltransferase family protein [Chlamydiales bacterium]
MTQKGKSTGKARIGIFGGTFDPIHLGHIAMAIFLKEAHKLDHVFFVPAGQNPHKTQQKITDASHRLQMVKRALKGVADCSILTLELERKGP